MTGLGFQGPVILTKLKMNGEKQASSHHNRFTYQYLRCMHGVELSHQKGRLKGHLRTAWDDGGQGKKEERKNRKERIRSRRHLI